MPEERDRQEAHQEPSSNGQTDNREASSILDQVDNEVEELEDEQIEWTDDMMPKFETPPVVGSLEEQNAHEATPGDQSAHENGDNTDVGEQRQEGVGSSTVSSKTQEGSVVEGVQTVQFSQFAPSPKGETLGNLDLLLDVKMPLVVELGRSRMPIRDILELGPGSVIELDRAAGEPVDLLVNGKLIARGEVVVIDESFGLRITEIIDPNPGVAQ